MVRRFFIFWKPLKLLSNLLQNWGPWSYIYLFLNFLESTISVFLAITNSKVTRQLCSGFLLFQSQILSDLLALDLKHSCLVIAFLSEQDLSRTLSVDWNPVTEAQVTALWYLYFSCRVSVRKATSLFSFLPRSLKYTLTRLLIFPLPF